MDFYTSTGELYHHGVKGQQWGVKNGPPYPLSDKEKKKISKQYKKTSQKAMKQLQKETPMMNKIADKNATEGTEEHFNKLVSQGYDPKGISVDDYKKVYDQFYESAQYALEDKFFSTNEDVKEGRELVKKYDMTSWDELAKTNEAEINRVREIFEHPKKASK